VSTVNKLPHAELYKHWHDWLLPCFDTIMFKPQASSKYELNKPVPYTLHIDDDMLHATKQKLRLARYPVELFDLAEDD
jgi:hypothetical protein